MKSYVIYLTYVSLLIKLNNSQEQTTSKIENEKNCRERNRLISTDSGDLYRLIDATSGQKLTLQCHYCNENDDNEPKIWYRRMNLSNNTLNEVQLGMENNITANRVHINPEHSLIIHNFAQNDTGFYSCLHLDGQENDTKYNFLIDLVYEINETSFEKGNLSEWTKYQQDYLSPMNKRFRESKGLEYVKIRENLKLEMEVMTDWEPWGVCEICGRPPDQGRRRKKGFCRLKINPKTKSKQENLSLEELFIVNTYALSCRSVVLSRVFPEISNLTKIIPHFVQEEPCQEVCNPGPSVAAAASSAGMPDAEGLGQGWKTGKTLDFKYKKTVVLAEHTHLTLVCPEATLHNVTVWKRNGRVLRTGDSVPPKNPDEEAHITVDTFNNLYLTDVRSTEEGNYTCEVDKTRMQQVRVYIVSKSRLLTQAFVRHMMYLAFVLSLTLPCYCAGLVVLWTRRRSFKTYQEAKDAAASKRHELENLL